MNLQQQEQFYQTMSRHSRVASSEARVTEMANELLVSKPATIKSQ